jgi:2,3-bisphosphoglycerate-dependent phosphoglycerate mutase
MRIYFIRHGQSANNALFLETQSRVGRHFDPELTTVGRQQAEVLGNFLLDNQDDYHIDVLYCSLMQRAVQTALPIARNLSLPLNGLMDMHESGGIYLDDEETNQPVGLPGFTPLELKSKYPELILPDDLDDQGWWNRPFETMEQRVIRARRLINFLTGKHADRNHVIALVSHQGFFNHFFFGLLGQVRPSHFWFTLNNVSITCIDITGEDVNAVYINRLGHLRPELVTW